MMMKSAILLVIIAAASAARFSNHADAVLETDADSVSHELDIVLTF